MLSRDEARAWAEIERRLVREDAARSRALRRLLSSVTAQTVVPLVLAALFALLNAQVPALFCLFMVPLGLVFSMARKPPPHAVRRSSTP
jgi:FtsH-binding integral membrane protein